MADVNQAPRSKAPLDDEERCDLTELFTSQCAHCKQGTRRPRMVELFEPAHHDVAYRFAAKWPGRCDACEGPFETGSYIARTLDGDYLCGDCA